MGKRKTDKKKENEVTLYFIGGNATNVTGSCIYGEFLNYKFLLELGGVQDGSVESNYRNNDTLLNRIDFENIDFIFLNHFHQDHSMLTCGAIPRGFKGKIITNHETARILKTLWEDSHHIIKEDVNFLRTVKGIKAKHFYNYEDIEETMNHINEYEVNKIHKLNDNISFRLLRNNHVLGSTSLELFLKDNNSRVHKLFYSSDVGSTTVEKYFVYDELDTCHNADIVIHESTYSNSSRQVINKKMRKQELKLMEDTIVDTLINKHGQVVMPCFSCDRTQNILVFIKEIFDKHEELNDIEVVVDGKLTSKIMKVYGELLEGEQLELFEKIISWKNLKIISDFQKETSLVLKDNKSKLILGSSGMCDKGHVLEYIKKCVEGENNTMIFTGYSSPTSLASRIKEKNIYPDKKRIKIEKGMYALNCSVVELHSFSSHIQRQQIIDTIKGMNVNKKIILVHGDANGRKELAEELQRELRKINKTTNVVASKKDMIVEF